MLKNTKSPRALSKINLHRETVRVLQPRALEQVLGGSYQSNGACTSNNCSDACGGGGHTSV